MWTPLWSYAYESTQLILTMLTKQHNGFAAAQWIWNSAYEAAHLIWSCAYEARQWT